MAKQKQEDPPKGSPAWMATFSDLMNLLLCFFVLLFSMSTVDAQKFQEVVASLQSAMSILPAGGASIGDGQLVSAGVRQLEFLDSYYNQKANSASKDENNTGNDGKKVEEQYKEESLKESEAMAEAIENQIEAYGIQDMVDVDFNAEYVTLNLSGAVLFESAQAELVKEAYPIVDKICLILKNYNKNIIEVEGHADNVPLIGSKYEDNDVLSMYRALNVANYIRKKTKGTIDAKYIKSSGRGSYWPIADNSTAEGRARNRRVEIKIYNSYNSNLE
ncbi:MULTISPECIES: OmpA/MotB family protein [Agathobacter]|uniref:Chemotaxis protein n=1 Tax=Agathobacter ruminis TaxID=1712665 RepID=A0A2G3E3S4_9FIRM|nr:MULTISPECIES: flagellar motor protein MotB [Agathobacter]MBQ1682237.1 flagellar motor protein MotB [Agathobacter sp.]MDC7302635.1 flagellar motor protein MotB [Agathobacter ruminis]PHU37805.1 chemotaxis protein [Agathobacter ruminis]